MVFDPVIECVYGWGQVMRIYDDHLDIHGTSHALVDLIAVHPTYYCIMGVSSARLELCFTYDKVIVRGIAAIEIAQQIVSHLDAFCRSHIAHFRLSDAPGMYLDSSQWASNTSEEKQHATKSVLPESIQQMALLSNYEKYVQETEVHSLVSVQNRAATAWLPRWPHIIQTQFQRRSKRLQAERARREHGFDIEQLTRRLQDLTLPQVYVPTRLLQGESAHYCTDATLCEEPPIGVVMSSYRVKDQGMLILTDRRMIYIGRRRQLVLDYSRLVHISHLRGAIGILSESWARREIFEVPLPLECTMYLDAILLRFHQKERNNERTQTRVRQLYPSTKTHSYEAHTTANYVRSEPVAHWQYSDPSNP